MAFQAVVIKVWMAVTTVVYSGFYRVPYRRDHGLYHIQDGFDDRLVDIEIGGDDGFYHIEYGLKKALYAIPDRFKETVFMALKTVCTVVLIAVHALVRKVLIPFTTVVEDVLYGFPDLEKKLLIAVPYSNGACLMFSQRSIQNCLKPSFVVPQVDEGSHQRRNRSDDQDYRICQHGRIQCLPSPFYHTDSSGNLRMIVIIVPTAEMIFPTTTRIGPIAAATRAIFTIVCCTGAGILLHISAKFQLAAEMSFKTGARTVARVFPISAPVSFREFMVILNWSIGSRVSLKVFSTLPSKSPREPARSSRLSFPVWTAL
jgi:hypothetical protein